MQLQKSLFKVKTILQNLRKSGRCDPQAHSLPAPELEGRCLKSFVHCLMPSWVALLPTHPPCSSLSDCLWVLLKTRCLQQTALRSDFTKLSIASGLSVPQFFYTVRKLEGQPNMCQGWWEADFGDIVSRVGREGFLPSTSLDPEMP